MRTPSFDEDRLLARLQLRSMRWDDGEVLVELLSAAATMSEAGLERLRAACSEHCADVAVAAGEAMEWIRAFRDMPQPEAEACEWLDEVEEVARALKGGRRLQSATPEVSALLRGLEALLDQQRHRITERTDQVLFAAKAEGRGAGGSGAPWSWLGPGQVRAYLEAGDVALLAERWVQGRLHAIDAAELAALVSGHRQLAKAYGRAVRKATAELDVMRWTPAWSLDVAPDGCQSEQGALLLKVKLVGGQLEVRQLASGTWWQLAGQPGQVVSFASASHHWVDEILGEMETAIHVREPSVAEDAWHGLSSLRAVAEGQPSSRALAVGLAFAEALARGPLSEAIAQAHAAFEAGDDTEEELERCVAHAVEVRVMMPEMLSRLHETGVDVAPLQDALVHADEVHAEHRTAAFVVDGRDYMEWTQDVPVDGESWWGARAAVERGVPRGLIETVLEELRDSRTEVDGSEASSPVASNVVDLPTWRLSQPVARESGADDVVTKLAAADAKAADEATPCAWLQDPSLEPPVGAVPVLLYDERNDRGLVAELRVRVAETGSEAQVWEGAQLLKSIAREAVRTAYRAAGSSATALRRPPQPFASHRFELRVPDLSGIRLEVDGSSLGLSAAVALASLWLDTRVPSDVAFTASLDANGRLGGVAGVVAKATGLARVTRRPVRLFCAAANEPDARVSGAESHVQADLGAVLSALGFDCTRQPAVRLSTSDRRKLVDNLIGDIERAQLESYGGSWTAAADLLLWAVDSLELADGDSRRLRARYHAALAYMHEGRLREAARAFDSLPPPTDGTLRALHAIVELNTLIDRNQLDTPAGQELVQALEEQTSPLEDALRGRLIGTLGRAYLHGRRAERAVPALRQAVEWHRVHEPWEAGRSRVYLSMALRESEQPEQALEQLRLADAELQTLTRYESPEYEYACRMYWEYELARVLVELERGAEASVYAERALVACRHDFWPTLGILRTHAWALRTSGQEAAADEAVAHMRAIADARVPEPLKGLAANLLDEAKGWPQAGGEVY